MKMRFVGVLTSIAISFGILRGVCAGIAEYFDLDPTLIRLAWALVCFLGGSGILAYIVAAIIIPSESTRNNNMM